MRHIDNIELMRRILTKKARGYIAKETVSEYSYADGQMSLSKRKITTKHVPADVNAVKALLQLSQIDSTDVADMTDQQLQIEKLRLINMLNAIEPTNKEDNNDTNQQL